MVECRQTPDQRIAIRPAVGALLDNPRASLAISGAWGISPFAITLDRYEQKSTLWVGPTRQNERMAG
jgi:hypothetical protein